ncbi:hypothetical protein B9Z55_023405 [Caenorhabditis nigoni]|uniref:Transmembrane protein n=1 Tax=Caenorhabditis nigoni TaxID=1611254 RepID=A0A2G5SPS6_9PELO|nr:hypothetical protein B9Z55_023405 [Caenorhabditis nigoni]
MTIPCYLTTFLLKNLKLTNCKTFNKFSFLSKNARLSINGGPSVIFVTFLFLFLSAQRLFIPSPPQKGCNVEIGLEGEVVPESTPMKKNKR